MCVHARVNVRKCVRVHGAGGGWGYYQKWVVTSFLALFLKMRHDYFSKIV